MKVVFPVPFGTGERPIDLYAHSDRNRLLTYGALIVGLMAFSVAWLMVVRVRWINVVLLAGALIYYGWEASAAAGG